MSEGSPPDAMYVVTDGELEISRHSTGADLLLNVCGPGDLIGELGVAHGRPRSATVRARGPVRVQRIGAEALDTLLSHPTAARALLTATTRRLDREEGLLRQHERMAALGALAAGLLHEVNNPAAAVQRGASRLRALLADGRRSGQPAAAAGGRRPVPDDPLARADAEAAVAGRPERRRRRGRVERGGRPGPARASTRRAAPGAGRAARRPARRRSCATSSAPRRSAPCWRRCRPARTTCRRSSPASGRWPTPPTSR